MSAPQLYYQPGGIAEKVLAHCTAIKQPFNPTVWAPNAHMQSAMGLLRTATAKGSYTRQLVMTSDHGTLGLDWWCGADKPTYAAPDAPIVMFIHGINGRPLAAAAAAAAATATATSAAAAAARLVRIVSLLSPAGGTDRSTGSSCGL